MDFPGYPQPWSSDSSLLPPLHALLPPSASFERLSSRRCALHITLPYGLASAEVILLVQGAPEAHWRASVGRYPEGLATLGVPITHVRPHWQRGFAQQRLQAEAAPSGNFILRFPIGTGGVVHAFLECEPGLPEIKGIWIEACNNLVPAEKQFTQPLLPAPTLLPVRCSKLQMQEGECSTPNDMEKVGVTPLFSHNTTVTNGSDAHRRLNPPNTLQMGRGYPLPAIREVRRQSF